MNLSFLDLTDYVQNVDRRTDAKLQLSNGVTASLTCDLAPPLICHSSVSSDKCGGRLRNCVYQYDELCVMLTLYHSIMVKIDQSLVWLHKNGLNLYHHHATQGVCAQRIYCCS